MTEEMVAFALQLRSARTLLGWKQADLATRAGLAQPTVARLEKATMMPRLSTVNRIRAVLKENGIEFVDNQPQGGFTMYVARNALTNVLNAMTEQAPETGTKAVRENESEE